MDYGTGAIFGCPAHDQRDFDFAKKYNLEIKKVVSDGKNNELLEAYTGHGKIINSDFLNGSFIEILEFILLMLFVKKREYKRCRIACSIPPIY